jgi:hypothetical protein
MIKENEAVARKSIGFMFTAKRPCGKLSAMSWDDADCDPAMQGESLMEWIRRGDKVEYLERFEGDPMPEWCAGDCQICRDMKGKP